MPPPSSAPKTADGSLIIGTLFVLCGVVMGAAYGRFVAGGLLLAIGVASIVFGPRFRSASK